MAKWLVAIFVGVMLVVPFSAKAQTAAAIKVGCVDMQKVMVESEKGKEAKKNLTDEADKLKKNVDQKQDELQKLKDSIERQGATMTPEARADKEKQYQTRLKEYQRLTSDYQTEFQQKAMEIQNRMVQDVLEIVKTIGDAEKYTLVLEKSLPTVLFANHSIDITDKVISRYNAESGRKRSVPAKK